MRFRIEPAIVAVALGCFAQPLAAAGDGGPAPDSLPRAATPPASRDCDYMKSASLMDNSMSGPMTGDPNVDFVTMMLGHHQGAIDMAKTALACASDPFVKKLAAAIIAAQETEISSMKQWLVGRAGGAR